MKTKIEDRGDEEGLLCPVCGSCWLHHESVAVFNRNEDAESGICVQAEGMNVQVGTDITQNPSSRRHGLSIRFWCETCGKRSSLGIAQHKGVTLLQWTPVA